MKLSEWMEILDIDIRVHVNHGSIGVGFAMDNKIADVWTGYGWRGGLGWGSTVKSAVEDYYHNHISETYKIGFGLEVNTIINVPENMEIDL